MSVPTTPPPVTDAPAVGADGKLLDASAIPWFHSPSDQEPLEFVEPDIVEMTEEVVGRGRRTKKLTEKAAMMQDINSESEDVPSKLSIKKPGTKRPTSKKGGTLPPKPTPSTKKLKAVSTTGLASALKKRSRDKEGSSVNVHPQNVKRQKSSSSIVVEDEDSRSIKAMDLDADHDESGPGEGWTTEQEVANHSDGDSDISVTEKYCRTKKMMSLDDVSVSTAAFDMNSNSHVQQ
ncbi:hypothetical protein FRC02_003394 [Tulasnella sp. 418]|nr:hypothetical protein FRC02_003394 [Tulasnella sp. 418]